MASHSTCTVISCRWDWCRSTFPGIDALDAHVKHEHIWPMKPMRRAEIALMRRMDLQSLHSSLDTDSSIVSRGLVLGLSRCKSPPAPSSTSSPQTRTRPENEELDTLDTFAESSSLSQIHPPQRLQALPALESLMRQDKHSGLSPVVEMFERVHGHKTDQCLRFPSHQRSPKCHPDSQSSGSSQEVVEQQLTQEDDVGSQPIPLPEPSIEEESTDTNFRWQTDDKSDVPLKEEIPDSEQSVHKQDCSLGTSPHSTRGPSFRCGSLDVPLDAGSSSSSQPHAAQGSYSSTQPLFLQTQAPYLSQATDWSQTQ